LSPLRTRSRKIEPCSSSPWLHCWPSAFNCPSVPGLCPPLHAVLGLSGPWPPFCPFCLSVPPSPLPCCWHGHPDIMSICFEWYYQLNTRPEDQCPRLPNPTSTCYACHLGNYSGRPSRTCLRLLSPGLGHLRLLTASLFSVWFLIPGPLSVISDLCLCFPLFPFLTSVPVLICSCLLFLFCPSWPLCHLTPSSWDLGPHF